MKDQQKTDDSHPPSGLLDKLKKYFRNPFFIKTQSLSEVTDFLTVSYTHLTLPTNREV